LFEFAANIAKNSLNFYKDGRLYAKKSMNKRFLQMSIKMQHNILFMFIYFCYKKESICIERNLPIINPLINFFMHSGCQIFLLLCVASYLNYIKINYGGQNNAK